MARISDVINSLRARVTGSTSIQFVRVFNNQFQYMEEGSIESFPFPNCFIEIVQPVHNQLGLGVTQADMTIRFHLGQTFYNAADGDIEENLTIFDLRDEVVAALTYFTPTWCSSLMKVNEFQDYEHTNVYHYILEFKCSFVDTAGDQTVGLVTKEPPTDLEIDASFDVTYMHDI